MTMTPDRCALLEKKFAIIEEISQAIVMTDNIQTIANLMLDMAIGYTNAEKGSLLIRSGDELTILAARGLDISLLNNYRVTIGEGIAGTVARNMEAVLVENIETDSRFNGNHRDRYRTKSFISCPLISRNRLLGLFNVNDKRDGSSFNDDEFTLLKTIANEAAIVLENAMLMSQLKANAAELEETNKKLIEMDFVKTEFLTRVSHELRTPLNSIKGSIYFLQHSAPDEVATRKDFEEIIAVETEKLISTVERQLDFLRLEDETRLVTKTLVAVPDVVRQVVSTKALRAALTRHGVSISTDITTTSSIVADKIRVIQMLANIVESLSTFAEDGDAIVIQAEETREVRIRISLSRPLRSNLNTYLFQMNDIVRGDGSDRNLKLYLAKKVADLHGWELTASETDDSFCTEITIPCRHDEQFDAAVNTTMELFVEFISEVLQINSCSVMLREPATGDLTIKSSLGLDSKVIRRTRITPGERIAGWVATEGKPLFLTNIERDPRFGWRNASSYSTKSLISLPLQLGKEVVGVLNLNNKKSKMVFDENDFSIAQILAQRVSLFLQRLKEGERKEEDIRRLQMEFDLLLEAHRKYRKKGWLLPQLTRRVMGALGCFAGEIPQVVYASLLYDLGLSVIDEKVLRKRDLQGVDLSSVRVHPQTTVALLKCFEDSDEVTRIILHHHEHFDGSGYPSGLSGDDIPLGARVISVVDAYTAMIEDRPHRPARSEKDALLEVTREAGTRHDPRVVAALRQVLEAPETASEPPPPSDAAVRWTYRASSSGRTGSGG